jgi:ABC-type Zn uptake system ZnuABC Zn-binding protein ZnuA
LGEQTISPDDYVYDFSFPKEAGNPNPHLWTNPFYALKYAEIVRDKLVERDPDNAGTYQANYEAFAVKIVTLDEAIKATAASIPAENRKLLTYHDSFAYFAPLYGFTVIGAIQPADFSEPSAQEVAGLIIQLREEEVPAIFGSEVFASPILDQIGREAGVAYVDTLRDDDLPGEAGDSDHSYIGLMVYDLKIMAAALGGDPTLMDSVDSANVSGVDSAVNQAQ